MNATELLAEFRKSRAESAFSELVRRYTNLVYSVARRRLSDTSLVQEAVQTVFIRLARVVPNVRSDGELAAWLHRTTVHASIDLWRSETRRRAREQHAVSMQPHNIETAPWNDIAPILDDVLDKLNNTERQAILLRFFEQKSMREVGLACGVGEDAAKMRVSRAMDRLRSIFAARGVVCGAAGLGLLLAERAVEAAPNGLVSALATLKVPAAGFASNAGLAQLLAHSSKAKLAAGLAVALAGAVSVIWLISARESRRHSEAPLKPAAASNPASMLANQANNSAVASANSAADDKRPDPLKLLQAVVRARNRVSSGQMELELARYEEDRPFERTNLLKLNIIFDGDKRRVESFTREYAYTSMASDAREVTDARMAAEGLDHEAAVRAGLLKSFASHHVAAYDGDAVMDYWENDGHPFQTRIDDPSNGGWIPVFDPRCLGLTIAPGISQTVEGCLSCKKGSAQLVGEDLVEGIPAWHVQVQPLDFWLDKAHPTLVLKHAFNGSTVISRYDDSNPRDALPIELTEYVLHGTSGTKTAFSIRHFTRKTAQFNIQVDPASWTLAGLGMQVGAQVIDYRIHRIIGYWNGSGLSENVPRKTAEPQNPPDRAALLALLDVQPDSPAALDAAQWILRNTPDGPDVEKAASIIADNHIENTNLVFLAQELERLRHRCATNLLEAMLAKNPSAEVRGNACLALATIWKDKSAYGKNKTEAATAEKLFERVISEFGPVQRDGKKLADLAKPELLDLRNLSIGSPAPETQGQDLDGHPIRLSDYRGKVVVLVFWSHWDALRPDVPALRELIAHMGTKPFAVLGVYCDDDPAKAREFAQKSDMTWPSLSDARFGPLATLWNNNGWPTFTVIDADGKIRFRHLLQRELPQCVDSLFAQQTVR
jgi:RNA polymerase sigma factor (sigma-70 family)